MKKVTVSPVLIGVLGSITKNFEDSMKKIDVGLGPCMVGRQSRYDRQESLEESWSAKTTCCSQSGTCPTSRTRLESILALSLGLMQTVDLLWF